MSAPINLQPEANASFGLMYGPALVERREAGTEVAVTG